MMLKTVNLTLAFGLAFTVWGCKKEGTSAGAEEPADQQASTAEQAKPEQAPTTEPATEPPASTEQAATAPEETKPAEPAEPPEKIVVVKLETTKGEIVVEVHPDWAPLGAERFLELVKDGFYTDAAFFRVMKDFMAQAGLSGMPKKNLKWQNKKIKDDPVKQQNKRGMVTFAMAGVNSRTTQFFINFRDNLQLDKMGFAPFGKVRDMAPVDALYSEYGDGPPSGKGPDQNLIRSKGNKYLKNNFPNLDYILTASAVEE